VSDTGSRSGLHPRTPGRDPDLAPLEGVHLFPVRHHSPRSSAVLSAFLAEVRPQVVLIEGPDDATSLVDVLVDKETRPPVAILGYRTDGVPGSSLWPFASYSPEYVAAKWGAENGAQVALIDVPIGRVLAMRVEHGRGHDHGEDPDIDEGELAGEPAPLALDEGEAIDLHEACARARGFRSFEEFWEASFEAPAYDGASFRAALFGYAELVRAASRSALHRARDAYMARAILAHVAAGARPGQIVAVVGAAHAAAFVAGDVDLSLADRFPAPVLSAATLIPFSFPRLAEQLGYGAGNRAPQYYQRAHDAGCDYTRATLEVLVEFTEHLRLRGFMASLADTIEAYRLAVSLAGLRGKAEPGLDEVREATIATLCRGDATHVDGFLWPSVIGRNVGKVGSRIGKNSLQEEFWRQVEERRLPKTDSLEAFSLKLTESVQVETSVFLHRLRVAGIPYASYIGKQVGRSGGSSVKAAAAQDPGGLDALERRAEAWEAQWTPSTDIALVEKIVLGDTIEQVAARALEELLAAAKNTGDAAGVLLEAVVASSAQTAATALAACDRFAAGDGDLPSLARSAYVLSSLCAYRTSRALSALGADAVPALCRKTFDRAVLRVQDACTGNDEAVAPARKALRTLHEVALAQPLADKAAWLAAARDLATSYAVNPGAAGLAAGLLYLAHVLSDDEVALLVGQRLSDTLEPTRAAGFLEGFFDVNALALVKSRPVVAALDAFLAGIDRSHFRDALPVLRRAFGSLGATERRYLLENVLAARCIGDKAKAAQAVLLEKDKEKLKAIGADLSQAMDDLDDLL
jgi:Family of unknown function (DUF5682)